VDEFNVSWQPTLKAMWSPKGQQIMIPTPGQPKKQYGIGGVNYHTGETVVIFRRHKRRPQIAEFLQRLLDKHPHETVYVAWDNVNTHQDDEVEAIVRSVADRLVLMYLPTYSPWLNPIEMSLIASFLKRSKCSWKLLRISLPVTIKRQSEFCR
jgi:putative transposase